ncbi:MAG TPA: YciI family protein [Acidimicrobiales bacterium]
MLLIYNNPAIYEALPPEEREALFAEVDALMAELRKSGEWLGGEALADRSTAKTVRVRDGVPVVTDGPFIEAKEQFAGYAMIDCETEERAVQIAARWPDAKYFAMEVRPLMVADAGDV